MEENHEREKNGQLEHDNWGDSPDYCEPNAALNITKVTTLLDNSGLDTSKVESKVVRLDTRNGYHGRNAMQVQEPMVSYKYRYVPMVILESNGPEALKPVMKANDDGHLVPTGEVVEKPYDELVMAKVSSGGGHTLSLRADGSIWAYGLNEHGQLGTKEV